MAMPEQLRKQVQEVDEFYAQQGADGVAPVNEDDTSSQDSSNQDSPVISQTLQVVSSTDTPVVPGANAELEALVHKHKTLQGMFNSQDVRYREALAQIEQLRNALTSVQSSQPAAPSAAPAVGVTEDERKEYTPEFFAMMDRWLSARLGPLEHAVQSMQSVAPAVQSLSGQVTQVAQNQQQLAEQRFFAELTRLVPEWEQINAQPAFHAWLNEVDRMTGISRQVYLNDARNRLDLDRTVQIFGAFQGVVGNAGTQSSKSNQSELAAQAVVTSRRSGSSESPASGAKVFSKADLDKLYDDYRRGVYKGRDAEFKAKEVELLSAISAGRYRR